MLLGIPYHASLIWAVGDWHFDEVDNVLVDTLGAIPSVFRMPVFFVIAGFFAGMLLSRRGTGEWIKQRAVRLCVPFLFGMIFITPACEVILQVYQNGSVSLELLLGGMLKLKPVWHLWFLVTLFQLCVLTAVLSYLGWLQRLDPSITRTRATLLAILVLALEGVAVPYLTDLDLWLLDHQVVNFVGLVQFFPYFAAGLYLYKDRRAFDAFLNLSAFNIYSALIAVSLFVAVRLSALPEVWIDLSGALARILMCRFFLSLMHTFANRESRWAQRFTEFSFSIYLAHMPFVLLLGVWATQMPPVLGFAFVIFGCLALSCVFALVVERSMLLRFAFNGVLPARARLWTSLRTAGLN